MYFGPELAYFEPDLAHFDPEMAHSEPVLSCFEFIWSRRGLCLYRYFWSLAQ